MGSIDKEIQLDSMVFIRDYGFRRCFTPEYQSGIAIMKVEHKLQTGFLNLFGQFNDIIKILTNTFVLILLRCRIILSKEKTLDTCEADM